MRPPPRHTLFPYTTLFRSTIVAQFWGFAADMCSAEQGKRLFPIIGGGSSLGAVVGARLAKQLVPLDRKSTRLNSSHSQISYAVFCLKKKNYQKYYIIP